MKRIDIAKIKRKKTSLWLTGLIVSGVVTTAVVSRALSIAEPGTLDDTFGVGGKVLTTYGQGIHDYGSSIDIQDDNKVVIGGHTAAPNGDGNFAVLHYNIDGLLDATFGVDGGVFTDFRPTGTDVNGNIVRSQDRVNDVAVQSDGKIVAAGVTNSPNGDDNFALVRYNADGSLDLPFGNPEEVEELDRARVIIDFRQVADSQGQIHRSIDEIHAIALQSDGKIVVVGTTNSPSGDSNFAAIRLNPDGLLDPDFGVSTLDPSRLITNFDTKSDSDGNIRGSSDWAYDVVIQADGKIVVVGYSSAPLESPGGGSENFALVRYNPDGSIDTTFGDNSIFPGTVLTDFDNCATGDGTNRRSEDVGNAAALDSSGRVIVAGQTDSPLNGACEPEGFEDHNFGLVRYSAHGIPDTGFGPPDNRVRTDLEITQAPLEASSEDRANDIAIYADGRIVAVGVSSAPIANGDENFALTRYFP